MELPPIENTIYVKDIYCNFIEAYYVIKQLSCKNSYLRCDWVVR